MWNAGLTFFDVQGSLVHNNRSEPAIPVARAATPLRILVCTLVMIV